MAAKTATPWGAAELVEELTLAQRAGEQRSASLVRNAGDVPHGAIRVRPFLVAEEDLPARLEVLKEVGVQEEAALPVLDRDRQLLILLAARGEGRVGARDPEWDVATDEREGGVGPQHSREKAGFAENLEAVADSEHEASLGGEVPHR